MKKLKVHIDVDFQVWIFGLGFQLEKNTLFVGILCFQIEIQRVWEFE